MSLDSGKLAVFVCRQLENFYPDGHDSRSAIQEAMSIALARTCHCISHVRDWSHGFDPIVSGQYATFLYFLSNEIWRGGEGKTATRLFLLNKALHGLELFYEVALPEVFLIGHTPGLVFAKAKFGNRIVFHQGCTIGHKLNGYRPVFDDGVVMFPNSMVIGRCHVRPNTVIAPGVCLVDTDTPGDCYVLPGAGRPVFKAMKKEFWRRYFV